MPFMHGSFGYAQYTVILNQNCFLLDGIKDIVLSSILIGIYFASKLFAI